MKRPNRRQAVALLASAPGALATAWAAPAPGERVVWPEVTLLDGTHWGPADAAGQAVVVVFWSTTCPFCRRHLVHVSRLQGAVAGLPLQLLTVARERDVQAVQRYMTAAGHRFAVTLDAEPMAAALSPRRMIPLTVTVDRAGHLKQVIPGEMFEADVLELAGLAG